MANQERHAPLSVAQIEFFMPMDRLPTVTHQQKQVRVVAGKPVFYEPPHLRQARAKLQAHLGQYRPVAPLHGALQAVIKWCYPLTANKRDGQYKTTRGDLDNMAKLLLDVMTSLHYWQDDAQIASLVLEKFWADVPGIYIRVASLEPDELNYLPDDSCARGLLDDD